MRIFPAYILSIWMFSSIAQGAVLVDTGEPTYTGGQIVCRAPSCNQSVALKINLDQATTITDIQTHLQLLIAPNNLTLALYSNGNDLPEHELYQSVLRVSETGWNGLSNLNWNLDAGSYWVTYQVREGQYFYGYLWGGVQRPLEVASLSGELGYWIKESSSYTGGLIVEGIPLAVPEPESYAMLLAGLSLIGFATRRRKSTL